MKENNNLVTDFVDEKGESFTMTIEPTDNLTVKLGNRPYKLQTPNNGYKKMKKKGIFTSDIGVKSSGFAPIFTLALIVALGGTLIAYLLWRF